MKTDDIVDYAMPLMNIERMAKDIHQLCLKQDYAAASEMTLHLGVEARLLLTALAVMQDKETLR